MMEKCMWCTTSLDVEGDEAIRTLLRRYSSGKLSEREMDSLNEDLSCCMGCVVEYHRSRDKVPELHKVLWEMEKTRLLRVLGSVLDQELEEDDDLFIIEDDGVELVSKMSPIEFQNSLRFPLFEVLKYPYLLCYRELCDMAMKALCMLQDINHSLAVFEKYQGTYLLLVHPNEKVRRWAIDAAKTMKSVDRDAYYDLQEIFTCMFCVIELGFCVDLPDSDPDSYAGGSVPRLPSHLYDLHNKKNYWLGICMLLTQLSAEAMDSLFMGQFHQFNIPLCILNTIDELKHDDDPASDPFWPALQCFMVILDRLGSKIWGQVNPILAFQTITGAANYTAEIRNIQKKTTGTCPSNGLCTALVELDSDDNMVTCSQMVYDCYASGEKSQASSSSSSCCISNNYVIYEDMQSLVNVLDSEMGQSMRVYGSTFLWFIPFVRSLMDLAELNASYISEVIQYLCDKIQINRHMLTGQTNVCDRVTEFFTRILIQILELHFNEGEMGKLYRCAPKWVEVIVMCSVLPDEAFSSGLPDRMGGIHRVSSTSNTLGVVGRLPASGDGVGAILVGCITLIRLLLKEGTRTGSDPRSTHYSNLLNKQLRRVPNSRWKLTKSESDELERCLKNIVRSMPARPASPASTLSSPSTSSIEAPTNAPLVKNTNFHKLQHEDSEAGPSRAGDASAPIKQETLYDCLSDEDFFSGFESLIEANKEPRDPVVSDPGPAVELAHIKPDLGVLQEIRSRLNNNKNLSKIKAIAQGKPGKPEIEQVGSGQKEPISSYPLTFQPVTTSKRAATTKKCGLRSAVDDDEDDEPLNIRRDHMRKSWKLESSDSEVDCKDDGQKHTISTSKESFSTIIISDDETSENDEEPTNKFLGPNDETPTLQNISPVFEFETQQYVASAWEDFEASVVTKPKLNSEIKPQVAPVPGEGSPSLSSETESIQDEDIERACQQAEEKIKQQQQPRMPSVSCAFSSSSKISPVEYWDQFIKPQILPVKNQKTVQSEKKDIEQSKKTSIIEALAHKVRRHSLKRSFSSPEVEEPPSTSVSTSGLSSAATSSSYFLVSASCGIPAVVPPKKVRKTVEPESTTKIYAPSSRSASLVLEMEKGDKPSPVVNVAKAKNAQPAPGMPPPKMTPPVLPPQFAQPLPSAQFARPLPPSHSTRPLSSKPILRPLSHAPNSVTSTKISFTSEPPSYKTYQRPEAPVNKPVLKMDQSQKFDVSVLTQAILKWEFSMFDNFKTFGSPDDLCQLPLKEVPVKFTSYLEYFNTLYPLLLINAFEEMVNEWLKQGRIEVRAQVQGMEYINRTASASFVAKLSREQEKRQLYPKEDDLVLLHLTENTGAYAHDEPAEHHVLPHFGYVSRSIVSKGGPGSTVNMTIQTRGNVFLVNTESVRCEVIGSLISTFREFRALCLLRKGPMLHPLLAPHVSYFKHSQHNQPKMDAPEYNMDQSRAIDCGLAMIKRTQKTPTFLLIHGPPGTGKSKTIGGLLYKLLSSDINSAALVGNFPSKTQRTRVLLCAPSNAAIDSLMKKVIVVFKEKCRNINAPQGNCGDINLVRLGSEKTISKILKPFSLDHQIRARAQRTQQTVEADIQKQKELLDQEIEVVWKHCAKAQKGFSEFKRFTERKMELLREMEGLNRKIKECRGKRQESQALVLQNAHVICCTLSTSGSTVLENAFRRLGHEPFSCVIIDEASQAKETETLIPMLYRCPAVILVGDPNQLPPTVVSQKAKELGYDQSLMVRLCKSLQSNSQPSPVFLLSMQYRMHPDICKFPSKYIYNNTLKNDCETAQKRCSFSWPFKPYRVFDVTDGRENKEGDSFSNHKEVKLVLMLLKLLSKKQSVRVGVITPYNAQKRKIMDAMRKLDFESKHLQVEVDTVDGFQGREMDCIIVSCVRASSETGSSGFLGNRERLNVTITRAKFSLFILGHLRTLRVQSDWGALIDDAKRRGTIIKTQERDYQSEVRKILKKDSLSRSLSHPPVGRPSNVTSPIPHVPMETGRASTSRPHPSGGLLHHQSTPRPIPLDCPRDPQITDRPTDPRFAERRPIGEQRQVVNGRGLSMAHQRPTDPRFTERRPLSEDCRNAAHSSRHTSKRFPSRK